MKFLSSLALLAIPLVAVACSSSTGSSSSSSGGSPSDGGTGLDDGSTSSTACSFDVSGTTFPYACASAATAATCNAGNATVCTAEGNKIAGSVAPGSLCQVDDSFELGDNCAADAARASTGTPKGSICFTFSDAPDPICTHLCTSSADCADVGTTCSLVSQGGTMVCKK